jgi:heptosyltransferase II
MPDGVAVRLPNWLGDTVMAVPALRALRAALRQATVLAAGPWASILQGQDVADALLTYPRAWSGRVRGARVVRAFRPRLAVVFPNSFESAAAAWYWRAERRVGYAGGGRSWLLTDTPRVPAPRRHQIDEYAALVEALGIAVTDRAPALAPAGEATDARRRARALMASAGVTRGAGGRVVGIHLGAAYGSSKLWPAAHVAGLARELACDGTTSVLLGPAACADVERDVAGAVRVPSLVGRDSAALLPALLTEIDVLVGGDTGVTHLAAALGTPVVALFGPTDPRLTAPRGRVEVVTRGVSCAPCFYRQCPIDHPCMRQIGADTVAERVRALAAARTPA